MFSRFRYSRKDSGFDRNRQFFSVSRPSARMKGSGNKLAPLLPIIHQMEATSGKASHWKAARDWCLILPDVLPTDENKRQLRFSGNIFIKKTH